MTWMKDAEREGDGGGGLERARGLLRAGIAKAGGAPADVFPATNMEVADGAMEFRVVYVDPSWAELEPGELERRLDQLHRFRGHTRRQYRNAVAFVIPGRDGPGEAGGSALADAVGLDRMYRSILLPRNGEGHASGSEFERIKIQESARGAEAGDIGEALHGNVMLALAPHLREQIAPDELARILGLGERDSAGIERLLFPMSDAARWFFCFAGLPRFRNPEPIRRAVRDGVASGMFALMRSARLLELDRVTPEIKAGAVLGKPLAESEIRFENGWYLVWGAALD